MFTKITIMGFDIVLFVDMMMTVSCDDSSKTWVKYVADSSKGLFINDVITFADEYFSAQLLFLCLELICPLKCVLTYGFG